MNVDQPNTNAPDNPVSDDSNLIASSMLARATWGQRVLSPWVQRSFQKGDASSTVSKSLGGRLLPSALTVPHTSALLNRLQRTANETTIWQPNVGSVNPLMVDRFSETIANRFAKTNFQDRAQAIQRLAVEETDLTLAGTVSPGPAQEAESEETLPFTMDEVRRALNRQSSQDIWTSSPETSSSPMPDASSRTVSSPIQRQKSRPKSDESLPFSLAEVRAALEQPHFTRSSSPLSPSSPPRQPTPSAQRASSEPAPSLSPSQSSLPRRRLHSRVEEVTPDQAGKPPQLSLEPNLPELTPSAMPSSSSPLPAAPIQRQSIAPSEASRAKSTSEPRSSVPPARSPQPASRGETIQRRREIRASSKAANLPNTPDVTKDPSSSQSTPLENAPERRPADKPPLQPKIDDASASTELRQAQLESRSDIESTSKPILQRQPEQVEVRSLASAESSVPMVSQEDEETIEQTDSPKAALAEIEAESNIQRQVDTQMPLPEPRRERPASEKPMPSKDNEVGETLVSPSPLQKTIQRQLEIPDLPKSLASSEPSKLNIEEQATSAAAVAPVEAEKSVDEMPLVQKRAKTSSPQHPSTKVEVSPVSTALSEAETSKSPKDWSHKSSDETSPPPIIQTKVASDEIGSSGEARKPSQPATQPSLIEPMPLRQPPQPPLKRSTTAQPVDEPSAISQDAPLSMLEDAETDIAKSTETNAQRQPETTALPTVSSDISAAPTRVQRQIDGDDQGEPGIESIQPLVGVEKDRGGQHQLEPEMPLRRKPTSPPDLAQRSSVPEAENEETLSVDYEATARRRTADAPTFVQRRADEQLETMKASKPADTLPESDSDKQPDVAQRQFVDEAMPLRSRSAPLEPKGEIERADQPLLETFTEPLTASTQAGRMEPRETKPEKRSVESPVQRQPLEEMLLRKSTAQQTAAQQGVEAALASEEVSEAFERLVDHHSGDDEVLPSATAPPQLPLQRQLVEPMLRREQTSLQHSEKRSSLINKSLPEEDTALASPKDVTKSVSSEQPFDVQFTVQRRSAQKDDLPLQQQDPNRRQPSKAADGPEINLGKNIIAKANTGLHLPLTKPLAVSRSDLTQTKSVVQRMAALPQARSDENKKKRDDPVTPPIDLPISRGGASVTRPDGDSMLPLAPPVRIEVVPAKQRGAQAIPSASVGSSAVSSTVQRQSLSQTTASPLETTTRPPPNVVQREGDGETIEPAAQPDAPATPVAPAADLDKLARQILPEIKRMLARERDRLSR